MLARLDAKQPVGDAEIIVLSEHVDYWNYLGWKDPFSAASYTARQQQYGSTFGKSGVYTPQMVVNGRAEFVGSDERAARREIQRAAAAGPAANVRLAFRGVDAKKVVTLGLSADALPKAPGNDSVEVWLAITESGLSVPVRAGENGGRTLTHVGVVRTLMPFGEIHPQEAFAKEAKVTLHPGWKLEKLRAVMFVQEKNSKRVLGATSLSLSDSGGGGAPSANGF